MAHYTRGAGQCITETFQTQIAMSWRNLTNKALTKLSAMICREFKI